MEFKSPKIHRTPLYRAKSAYYSMTVRCKNRSGKNPAYKKVKLDMSLEQWLEWAVPKYQEFEQQHPGVSPSASRLNDEGDYKLDNIEIISMSENRRRQKEPYQAKDGIKRCSRCKACLPVAEYSKRAAAKDGYQHWCRNCCSAQNKLRGA